MSAETQKRPSEYIHGTTPDEQKRLAKLNGILNQASLAEMRIRKGERILDVGCGLAQLTRAMASQAGAGARAAGVERSPEQIAEARRLAREAGEENLVELRQGEAADLPLRDEEWGSFDLVHARFLLEHVPDPHAVVQGMVRSIRPGGRIVLEDDDHDVLRLWPEPPGFGALWNAYVRVYDRMGNDPYMGRRLVSLLHQAGARPVRNTWLFFGSCAGHENLDPMVENMIGLLTGAEARILELLDRGAFDQAIAALRQWKARPDAAMWFATAWAEGARPS